MQGFDWSKVTQFVGGLLYAGAAAVAGGAVPVPPQYAWIPAAVGVALRTFSNSNALVPGAAATATSAPAAPKS